MPRKNEELDPRWFDDECCKVFKLGMKQQPVTTLDERKQIVLDWCRGDYKGYRKLAEERGLIPAALLTACMVDVEHPLLVEEGYFKFNSLLAASLRLLEAELHGEVVLIPDSLVHSRTQSVHTPCVQVPVIHRQDTYATT